MVPRCSGGLYSLHLAFLTVKCRPFDKPWKLTAVIIRGVYVPLNANMREAVAELYNNISEQQKKKNLTPSLY